MARAVRVLVLLLMLGQATGISLADIAGVDDCDADCEDAATGKACPPACTTCGCAMRIAAPTLTARPTGTLPVPLVTRLEMAPPASQPTSPDPREILHVPKSLVV